jgi:glycosyltransferase involved in cell wall biosynthesis
MGRSHVSGVARPVAVASLSHGRLRVMHVITGLSVGGAETMLRKVLQGMDRSRFENSVAALTDIGPVGKQIEEEGTPVTALGMRRGVPDPVGVLRLAGSIRKTGPHVVQTWLYHADLVGTVAARLAGNPPVIWNIRCSFMGDDYYRGLSGLVIRALAILSRRPAAVIHNSQAGRDLHDRLGYRPKRWELIPNGFDTSRFVPNSAARNRIRSELGIAPDTPLIGMVARLDAVKGHRLFLQSAQALLKLRPATKFILVGDGCTADNSRLGALVPADVAAHVFLLGERTDVPDINAAFDLATCASSGEGFPNVIGEAMSCGVPCVVTDVGECREIVGETGIVVRPDEPRAMAEAWNSLLNLPSPARVALSAAARARIVERYDLPSIVTRYEDLYAGIAAGATSE